MNVRRTRVRCLSVMLAVISLTAIAALTAAGCGDGSVAGTSTSGASTTVTAPASSTTTTAPTCSASRENIELLHQGGLAEDVESMRAAIFEAAMSCDYEALESLALAGSGEFTFSFGGQTEGPAAYWRSAEERGDPVLAMLVTVLNVPYGREDGLVVWPFAHALDFQNLNPAQEDLLAQFFTPKDIDEWKSFGGYLGYRVGISESGDWMFFVAGD